MENKYIATILLTHCEGLHTYKEFYKEEYNTSEEFKEICDRYVKKSNQESKNIYVFRAERYRQLAFI